MAAEQDGGVRGDVGVDQVGGKQVREDLDDFRLRGGIVGKLPAGQFPRLLDGPRAVEQCHEAVSRVAEPVELIAGGIAHDVPALAAVIGAARSGAGRSRTFRPCTRYQLSENVGRSWRVMGW